MTITIPATALAFGFAQNGMGSHGSRTLMLSELRLLLTALPPTATLVEYQQAVVQDNVLLKKTISTRQESFRRLREMYALDNNVRLFQALRDLWEIEAEAQRLLALLCAVARDPLLRETAEVILNTPFGTSVTKEMLLGVVSQSFPERLNATSLVNVGKNTASSWQQSGHLVGRINKVRHRAKTCPASTTYALLLGYLCEARGDNLFETFWSRLLDAPKNELHDQAGLASQSGWLDYRHTGNVTDISFRYLLRD
ncbi:MAG: hypothetical protein WCS37_18715 [Chloroflexota bacterium]|nr:hypothetical protein [Chloroflexota bacterium]